MTVSEDKTYLIYTLLKELFLLLDHGDQNLFQEFDLSVARYNALMHMIDSTVTSPSELGIKMLCNKANITRLLHGMEEKSYIQRIKDENDGRRVQIKVKPKGESLWKKAKKEHDEYTNLRFQFLTLDEQDVLLGLLMRIRTRLQELLKEEQSIE